MNKEIIQKDEYKKLIEEIKTQVQTSQIKASISVNKELLKLYWNIAQLIVEKQKLTSWGDGFIKSISKDLQKDFPNIKGFSTTNIKYMRKWYLFYSKEKSPQLVDFLKGEILFQIPWGHNREIITKSNSLEEAIFYVRKTIENNWSRNVLMNQIEYKLYERQGGAITNFKEKLPAVHSDLAIQTLKDPYCFDFLTLTDSYNEKELEDSLVENITKFLLELGSGFSYIGRQYKLEVGNDDFYIDLLFYHVKLHSYVVVELKTGEFKPEYAGKLNFYVSVVDDLVATKGIDKPTIGILICKSKNDMVVEYSLRDLNKPIGISEYKLTQQLPKELKSSLPSIEEIEAELEEKPNFRFKI